MSTHTANLRERFGPTAYREYLEAAPPGEREALAAFLDALSMTDADLSITLSSADAPSSGWKAGPAGLCRVHAVVNEVRRRGLPISA